MALEKNARNPKENDRHIEKALKEFECAMLYAQKISMR